MEPGIFDTDGGISWRYEVSAGKLPGPHSWRMSKTKPEMEWQSSAAQPTRTSMDTPDVIEDPREFSTSMNGILDYPRHQGRIRAQALLEEVDTLTETATFHNVEVKAVPGRNTYRLVVPQAQTVKTQSGLEVTLPVQQETQVAFSDGLTLQATVAGFKRKGMSLPASPLFKRHQRGLEMDLTGISPGRLVMYQYGADASQILMQSSLTPEQIKTIKTEGRLKELTLSFRQTAPLRSFPMTFTLPVKASEEETRK
jgi:hypothetical protein